MLIKVCETADIQAQAFAFLISTFNTPMFPFRKLHNQHTSHININHSNHKHTAYEKQHLLIEMCETADIQTQAFAFVQHINVSILQFPLEGTLCSPSRQRNTKHT